MGNAEKFLRPGKGSLICFFEQDLVAQHVPVIRDQGSRSDSGVLHRLVPIEALGHGVADQRCPLLLQQRDQPLFLLDQGIDSCRRTIQKGCDSKLLIFGRQEDRKFAQIRLEQMGDAHAILHPLDRGLGETGGQKVVAVDAVHLVNRSNDGNGAVHSRRRRQRPNHVRDAKS
jgi:hypothetical protein